MRNSDPDSRLKNFRAEQSETEERHARIMEELQTRQRIRNIWVHLEGRDKVELTPDRLARWLVTLAELLAGFRREGVLESIKPNNDIQKEALHLLNLASDPKERGQVIEAVAERLGALSQIERTWGQLVRCLKTWLPAVILGEEPPPEIPLVPPDGWEGPYPKPVEDLLSFCDWLDLVIRGQDYLLPLTTLGKEVQQDVSTGRAIRNAYRLIDKLGILAEMPKQPEGPFTVVQETVKLRNLKRVALRLLRQKSAKGSKSDTKSGTGGQGAGIEVEPPHSISQPRERRPPELSPAVQAILATAKADKAMAVEAQRTSADEEARLRVAIDAWGQLGQSRGVILKDLPSRDSQLRHYAELIVELGQRLKADGWQARVESIPPGPEAKTIALEILRQGMAANLEAVLEMLQGCADTLFQVGFDVEHWLRHGLRDEVLRIRPAPVPPSGWEGPYLEAVETPSDLIKWIDNEFQVQRIVGRGQGNQPSDGHLVRNAYLLVDQLNLAGMPLEPPGPFTLNQEFAILRNLRRLIRGRVSSASPADPESRDAIPTGPIAPPTDLQSDSGSDAGIGRLAPSVPAEARLQLQAGISNLVRALESNQPKGPADREGIKRYCDLLKKPLAEVGEVLEGNDLTIPLVDRWEFHNPSGAFARNLLQFGRCPNEANLDGLITDFLGREGNRLQNLRAAVVRWWSEIAPESNPANQHPAQGSREVETTEKPDKPGGESSKPRPAEEWVFAPSGNGYFIAGFGESGHLANYKGLADIARLIQTPGRLVPMLELIGADEQLRTDRRSRQLVHDKQALQDKLAQLSELREDLDRAKQQNNTVDADTIQNEIQQLVSDLNSATGLGGKARDLNNPFDKWRPMIHRRVNAVCQAMRKAKPPMTRLAEHFKLSISAEGGTAFVYRPANLTPPWQFQLPDQK